MNWLYCIPPMLLLPISMMVFGLMEAITKLEIGGLFQITGTQPKDIGHELSGIVIQSQIKDMLMRIRHLKHSFTQVLEKKLVFIVASSI